MHTMNRKYINGTMADQLIHEDEMIYVINNQSNVNNSPGYDGITVDPNCVYDDEIVVDIEEDQIEMNTECDNVAYSFEPQPPEDVTFDIANVNINDLLSNSIDTLNIHDEILFATRDDGIDQFDLAKYVDGGKLASLDTKRSHQEGVGSSAFSEQQIGKLPTKEHTHSNTAENVVRGNFRQRKILSRAFVDTTEDSDSENETGQQRKTISQFKKHKDDDDPMWKLVLAPKTTCKTRGESAKKKSNEKSKIPSTAQSNGLRNILKERMLSNRPMKKLVALPAKTAAPSTQKRGVGRGKDISITAKYFDLSAKQSDNSNCYNDDPFSPDNLDDDSESIESTKIDEMEENEKVGRMKIVDDSVAEMNEDQSNGASGDNKANVFEKQAEQKKTTAKAPTLIDNIEFVDMKAKPMKRESQKKCVSKDLLKRPPMLININKFKTNHLPAIIRSRPLSDLKPPNSDLKLIKTKIIPQTPIKTENHIKSGPQPDCIEQAIDETSASNDAKSDATSATSSKKKLHIREYSKRKCINPLGIERVKVCRDDHSYVKPSESTATAVESSLYEEITSVSIGCATDISIPELRVDNISGHTVSKAATRLSDIQTCLAIEQGKISSNSLISSIQSVNLNKSTNQMQTADCVDKKNPSNKKSEKYELAKADRALRSMAGRPIPKDDADSIPMISKLRYENQYDKLQNLNQARQFVDAMSLFLTNSNVTRNLSHDSSTLLTVTPHLPNTNVGRFSLPATAPCKAVTKNATNVIRGVPATITLGNRGRKLPQTAKVESVSTSRSSSSADDKYDNIRETGLSHTSDSIADSCSVVSDMSYTSNEDDWTPPPSIATSSSQLVQKKKRTYRRPPEDRLYRRKEQNKTAANRYRLKKEAELEILLDVERSLIQKNAELQERSNDVDRETRLLKSILRELFQKQVIIN